MSKRMLCGIYLLLFAAGCVVATDETGESKTTDDTLGEARQGLCGGCPSGELCCEIQGYFANYHQCQAECSDYPWNGVDCDPSVYPPPPRAEQCAQTGGSCCNPSQNVYDCRYLDEDEDNCGSCGTVCTGSDACISGECIPITP